MRFHILFSIAAIAALKFDTPSWTPHEFTAVVSNTVAQGIAVTPKGGWVYIVGSTTAPDYPTTSDAFDRTCGTDGSCDPIQGRFGVVRRADVVLTLIDSAGQIEYSTFLGGMGQDELPRIAVARDGTVWLAGATTSTSFEGYAGSCAGSFWIARFDYTLKHLQELRCYPWLLSLGDIALDAQGRLWVLGTTGTAGIATPNAYQRQIAGQNDMFVARFAAGEATPQYATYLGGRSLDAAGALAISPSGAIAITGRTSSLDFPVVRAVGSVLRGIPPVDGDAVVAVLDPAGQLLEFSTYWGGSKDDAGRGIAVDGNGNLYVTGFTRSFDMPATAGAYDGGCGTDGACNGSFDGFITKFSPTGALLASTFLGGRAVDTSGRIQLTVGGKVVVLGSSQSPDFPVVDAVPSPRTPAPNFEQVYLAVFDDRLNTLIRSGFVVDQQFLPNIGVLAVREGFGFVAAQVFSTTSPGLRSAIGTYVRAMQLP